MAFVAEKAGIWLFDSFEGMPEPSGFNRKPVERNIGSVRDCQKVLFDILKLNRNNIKIVRGWFKDILPRCKENIENIENIEKIEKIAILRIDADFYESTKICLEELYDNVILGGFIVIDDYGMFSGCKLTVDEFIKKES